MTPADLGPAELRVQTDVGAPAELPRFSPPAGPPWLALRLSLMFFLDIAVIAAYFPLLTLHLRRTLGESEAQATAVFAMGPLATLVGPMLVGLAADRLFPANRTLLVLNLLRAGALLFASQAEQFPAVLLGMALVGLTNAPSVALTSTIAFHHLRDGGDIGRLRVWGTVGWVATLWVIGGYLGGFGELEQLQHTPALFRLAAGLALSAAACSLLLPHTPPVRVPAGPLASLQALALLRRRSFRSLIAASMLASMAMQLNFVLQPLFFTDQKSGLGMDLSTTSSASSLSQLLEILVFPMLGAAIRRFGLRRVLLVGCIAGPVRFAAYALGEPVGLVVGSQVIHGVGVVFGMVAAQVAVQRVAAAEARASSQALLMTAMGGAGNLSGQVLASVLLSAFVTPNGGHAWSTIYLVPLALGLLSFAVIARGFTDEAPNPASRP